MIQAQPPQSGAMLDKYELLEKVGEGGMAQVYRGRHTALGRMVAIKVLHPHLSSTERNRLRFEREARAIETLHHDNILQIFDYSGRDSHTCYIVTEFIEGRTLKDILQDEGRIPSEVAALVGVALCEALEYAHSRGIVHRDIKPENVMLRDDGVVKLMDFGIARVLDESSMTLTGGLVGSPAYMSPEQASDQDIDARTDLFSLGTLLYRCVTGHLPFPGSNAPVILRNILDGNYADAQDIEPGISPRLAEVIKTALKTDPAERYETAEAMGRALRAVLLEAAVPAGPEEILRFLRSPRDYEDQLRQHLSAHLPEVSREMLARGDTVSAMRLLNRVLYLDEHNETVRALIQSLYRSEPPLLRYAGLVGLALLLPIFAYLIWGLQMPGPLTGPLTPAGSTASSSIADPPGPGQERAQPALSVEAASSLTADPIDLRDSSARTSAPEEPAGGAAQPLRPIRQVSGAQPAGFTSPRAVQTSSPGPDAGKSARALEVAGAAGVPPAPRATGARAEANQAIRNGSEATIAGPKETSPQLVPVTIRTNYPFADLSIDGESYGKLGQKPISLHPGPHRLRFSAHDFETLEVVMDVPSAPFYEPPLYELVPLPALLEVTHLDLQSELSLGGESLGTVARLSQPILIRKLRNAQQLRARLPDGSVRTWTIPALEPRERHVIDARERATDTGGM